MISLLEVITSCALIQRSESHSRQTQECMVLPASVTGGSFSLILANAVEQ